MGQRLTSWLSLLFGAVGFINASQANAQAFSSVEEAQQYLAQNPTGPQAPEAFRVIVNNSIVESNPALPPSEVEQGYSRRVLPGAAVTTTTAQQIFERLSQADRVPSSDDDRDDDRDDDDRNQDTDPGESEAPY